MKLAKRNDSERPELEACCVAMLDRKVEVTSCLARNIGNLVRTVVESARLSSQGCKHAAVGNGER